MIEVKQAHEYTAFDEQAIERFLGIWRERLNDAIHFHKRDDLQNLATRVIRFAQNAGAGHLTLHAHKRTNGEQTAFLYNNSDGSFLEIKA